MRMLLGGGWTDGHLDLHRAAGEILVEIRAMMNLERISGLYFVRERSVRMVWNYVNSLGPRTALRKVFSRASERHRNEKYFSVGYGRVLEADAGSRFRPGTPIVFGLPIGPACAERLPVAESLAEAVEALPAPVEGVSIRHLGTPPPGRAAPDTAAFAGWSVYSGRPLEPEACRAFLGGAKALLEGADWASARALPPGGSPVRVTSSPAHPAAPATGRKRAALYGLGGYAKTVVMPLVKDWLDIECIHEVDPAQFPRGWGERYRLDTRPHAPEDAPWEVALVAGFHHTHARIAVDAIAGGRDAAVEKPVVTDRAQLAELVAALRRNPGRLHSCFQKRFSPFNAMARKDLGVPEGGPISYHCIVYEVPLPRYHWYNWPNSGSRLLSNGCHWIDHFLFLNGYGKPVRQQVFAAPDRSVNCSVVLENGAHFSMVLTDIGSARIGVQDHVELRAGRVTVKVINADTYVSEDDKGFLRRKRINKMVNYANMYRTICKNIHAGVPGDSLASLEVSSGLILDLEDEYRSLQGGKVH